MNENLEIVDSVSFEFIELKKHNKVLNSIMSNILNEMTKMKECLMRRKKNIAELESISVCSEGVEESILEVMDWTNPQMDSIKPHSSVITDVYHPGSDPGEVQKCYTTSFEKNSFYY